MKRSDEIMSACGFEMAKTAFQKPCQSFKMAKLIACGSALAVGQSAASATISRKLAGSLEVDLIGWHAEGIMMSPC